MNDHNSQDNYEAQTLILNDSNGNELFCYLCLLYTSPSPRDATLSRMPSSA